MQRTGIYVFKPSTVTIHQPSGTDGGKAMLISYRNPTDLQAIGTVQLEPGIYQVLSQSDVHVSGDNIQVVATASGKDDWPDPKANVIGLEPGSDPTSILRFFSAAKDASPND